MINHSDRKQIITDREGGSFRQNIAKGSEELEGSDIHILIILIVVTVCQCIYLPKYFNLYTSNMYFIAIL